MNLRYIMNRIELLDPKYKKWRKCVFARDKYCCVLCGSKKGIQAHHIKKFAEYIALRYVVKNGATLCYDCHMNKVTGKEKQYEAEIQRIVNLKTTNYQKKKLFKKKWKPRDPRNYMGI